jgi:hypothetical protein
MSDPSSWPRDDYRNVLWGDAAPGILVARLPSDKPAYEPIIVTTLRRYVKRGASDGLLHRIAGSPRDFRILNSVWDLDGRALHEALSIPKQDRRPRDIACPGELGVVLSVAERRIALYQVIADRARGGKMMPTTYRLARFFGVTRGMIDNDLDVLRGEGRIACSLAGTVWGPRRVFRLVGDALELEVAA